MGLLEHMKRDKIPEKEGSPEDSSDPHAELKGEVHERLLTLLDLESIEKLPPNEQDQSIREDVANELDRFVSEEGYMISRKERNTLIEELIDRIIGLGPLQELVERDDLSEIMVNGPDEVYVEPRGGDLKMTDVTFKDEDHLMTIINKIVRPIGRRVDTKKPYVDARLPDDSRVNIIIPPLVDVGPTITIRDFKEDPFTCDDLVEMGSFSQRMADFLSACVRAKLNIMISGGTGSGKTTTLNVLSSFIPENERIITIEDVRELDLQKPHVLACESRPPNVEGEGEVTIRDLVKNSLRMRPDRIVVGECRGAEAFDMLQAMNTGHEGSLTTIHSNSPREACSRLESLVMMAELDLPQEVIRSQIASALDVVLQQDKMQDGSRKVTKISEVVGMESGEIQMNAIFEFDQETFEDGEVVGRHRANGIKPAFQEKFERLGFDLESTLYVENL